MPEFDFGAASFFLDLINFLKNLPTNSQISTSQKRIILEKFENALVETEIYIRRVNDSSGLSDHLNTPDHFRNRGIEEDLARLWRDAAVSAKDIEESLTRIAYSKSEFWINRKNWSRAKIIQNGIDIEAAREEIRKIKL